MTKESAGVVRRTEWGKPVVKLVVCVLAVVALGSILDLLPMGGRAFFLGVGFLFVVFTVSILWGRGYALFTAVLAGFAFTWLLPPVHRLYISESRDAVALIAFLATGVVGSHLSGRIRREAENAVIAQERFRDLVDSVEGIVWEADAATFTFSFVSEQAERVLGYPTQQWLAEPTFWKDHLHPEDRERAVQCRLEAAAEKRNHDFEYRMMAADGHAVWIRDLVAVVVEDGGTTRLRGVMVDATDRKNKEQALRAQADLLNLTHDAIFVRDIEGKIQYWNRGAEEMYGWTAQQATGKISHELLKTISPFQLDQLNAELMRVGRWEGELIHTKKFGTPVVVASRWSLQRDERGTPIAVLEINNDISEQKKVQEALRRSERELREVIESVPAMVWTATPDGSSTFVSKRWTDYTGLSAGDTAGTGWKDVVHPNDLGRYAEKWRVSVDTGNPFEDEVRFRRAADGEYRWFWVTAVPLRNEKGNIVKWYGIVTDIEDRRRAEDALKQSEANLAEAQRLTHTGSFSWNVRTKDALYLSEEWYRIYGFENEIGGRAWEERVARMHPDDRHKWESAVTQAILEKTDYEVEYRLRLPNGITKYVHTAGHPVLTESGEVVQFTGSITDVTERKRAELALQRSETYLAEAQRLSHTGSWAWDPVSKKIIYCSDELLRIFGFDPEEDMPDENAFAQRTHPEDRESLRESMRVAIANDANYSHEFRIVLPNGAVRHIESIGHVLLDSNGKATEYVGTLVDVTDRKRAEQERERLQQLEDHLAHMNRMTTMGELTASLAHEINQPIAAAMTNASTCLRWLAGTKPNLEQARETASRIVNDANRAAQIISRLRSLFKKGTTQREPLDINAVIDEMVVLLGNEANRHNVAIRKQLAADLPTIIGDRVQLQQVLMNLMINGVEAMKSVGANTRELSVTSRRESAGELVVSISDTGIGLSTDPGQIFEPFYTTKPDGTGMGLAISRTIIEAHGGRLWATPNPEGGVTFSFTFPITDR